MERKKRKQIPGAHRTKSIHRAVKVNSEKIHQPADKFIPSTINHQTSSIYNTCPHCAGIPFETIVGICEDKVCPDCEHKKTAWLIQKYQADEEARKKKKFAPIEPGRKRKHIRTNFLSK